MPYRCFLLLLPALLAVFLVAGAPCALAEAPDGKNVMTKVYDRADGDDRHYVMTMTLINKSDRKRVRKMESFSKDYGRNRKSIMVFREPADVKGTMFLSWEYDALGRDDDKWLYMPAMKKDRRISGASRNEYFMGSDFTYDDMNKRHPDKDRHALLGEENMDGRDCWKVECVPLDESEMYTRRVVWVCKEACLVVRSDYYDKDGLLKTYEAKDIRLQDGYWNVYLSEIRNVSREHRTQMRMDELRYDTGVRDDLFTVTTLQRGRIQ